MDNENKVMGTVGALIGSLLALGVYLLLGRLNIIAAIGGAAAFVTIFGGYYLLGKGMSKFGVIICAVILIAIVYISVRLDLAISISSELRKLGSDYNDFTVSFCFKNMSTILELADAKGEYIKDLALSYLFTALGGGWAFMKFAKS